MEPATVQRFLDANFAPWVRALDPIVSDVGDAGVTLDIPITDAITRVGGIVAGQAMATLADTAMVLACGAQRGEMVPVATVTLDTQFLRPGTGDMLRAEAEVIRAGRALIFARCTLTTLPGGKPVAVATATFATV
ncbi:MAG: PaaI family thioesterase [Pseudomonadota bacterium]